MSTDRWDQRGSHSDRVMLRPLPTSLVIRSMIFVLLQGFVQDLQSRSFELLGVYGAAPCAVYTLSITFKPTLTAMMEKVLPIPSPFIGL